MGLQGILLCASAWFIWIGANDTGNVRTIIIASDRRSHSK